MGNLDKLSQKFDLKNLDAAKFTQTLTEHQNALIKAVLAIGTLLLIGMMFNDQHTKESGLRVRISEAHKKIEAIKARDKAVSDLNAFKALVPRKLNEFELITEISDLAKANHVNIASLSPGANKDMGLYDLLNVSFNAATDNFKDMMIFLRKIEKSNLAIRIDSWSGQEAADKTINFSIQISAVLIHT